MRTFRLGEAIKPRSVAVVVAGAGARGGYEAGVLSVLLPRLEAAGAVPTLFVGTSAGAINATLFAATAHLPACEQAYAGLELWRGLHWSDVFRSPLWTGWCTTAQWVGQLLHVPGVRLTSLLDTGPLWATAERAVDWHRLRRNIDEHRTALAVVATSGVHNRTMVFVDRADQKVPPPDDDRAIDYRAAPIGPAHVLASAAIPALFPPVWVPDRSTDQLTEILDAGSGRGRPSATVARSGGWYIDGGVRLNAPLKPALSLDADAVVIVATHPSVDRAAEVAHTACDEAPDVDDVLVRVMDAALVDRMVEDVRTLATINELLLSVCKPDDPPADGAKVVVPYLAVGPAERGTLGKLASTVFDARTDVAGRIHRALRDPTMRLLGRLTAGDGNRRGDLLSYLYFDPEFMEASIALGRRHAAEALAGAGADEIPWQLLPMKSAEASSE